jgi:multidrug efflux pump
MRFTDTFIRRPIFAISISLLILLLGAYSYFGMQVREYPKVTNTVITVTTHYYGADSNLIQGFITQPIEQAIAQADNIDFMTSSSTTGTSLINVTMKINTDPKGALADILAKVNSVKSQMPSDAQDSTLMTSTGATTSAIYIAFNSEDLNASQLTDYLDRVVTPQLFTISGVAKVNLYGGIKFGMRVWLDPTKMAALDITSSAVMNALQTNNYQSATGQANSFYTKLNSSIDTQVASVNDLQKLIIETRSDGQLIRLGDIAKVSLDKSRDPMRALADGKKGVIVAIDVTPTANPLLVAAGVRDMMPSIKSNLPSSMQASVIYDSSLAIEESINEVIKTIAEAAIIVIIVITLFLGSLRAALIPIITIPLSIIGVGLMMNIFGFTINLMTLLAMVLAIGLVVDDAIVVVENVDRHLKRGETLFRAAIIGSREIAMPVMSMTVTLVAVYSPIALMGGVTGSLFKEFALTLAGSVVISGIIALTLSPMMCSYVLKHNVNPSRFERTSEACLHWITLKYSTMLAAVLEHKPVILCFVIIVIGSIPLMFKFIPAELAPIEDNGVVMIMGNAPATSNLDYIQNNMEPVIDIIDKEPAAATSIALIGVPDSNQSFGIAPLVPWSQRDKSQKEVQKVLGDQIKEIPGMSLVAFDMPQLPGASSGMPVQFVITTSKPFESLFEIGSSVFQKVQKSPLFVFSIMDLKYDGGNMTLSVKRDLAGRYGISMQDIGQTLSAMMGNGYVNRINIEGRSYEVIPQAERKDRTGPESLEGYYLTAADGRSVPLSSLVDISVTPQPRALPHFNQMNSLTISAVTPPGSPIGNAVNFLQTIGDTELPTGFSYSFLGESRQFVEESGALYITFTLAIAIIFLVLASQFESFRDPLVILVSVPLAMSGALIALGWTHVSGLTSMNIYTQIGLITLVGLICKHGILILEVAKEEQIFHNANKLDAIKHAAKIRLRPILMTTAAMVAGLLPLLLASGSGAAARFNIGLVIVAGLSIGTLFTLFVLPVMYMYLAQSHKPLQEFDETMTAQDAQENTATHVQNKEE